MLKTFCITLFVAAVIILFTVSSGFGQIMQRSLSCDVIVNGHTITFPKGWMKLGECKKMADDLRRKDKTGANIQCVCLPGVPS